MRLFGLKLLLEELLPPVSGAFELRHFGGQVVAPFFTAAALPGDFSLSALPFAAAVAAAFLTVGNMLYELLHGQPPFTGTIASVLHAQVFDQPRASTAIPEPIMQVLWKATAKGRDQRFASCEEFAGALHYLPRDSAAPAHAPPPTSPSEWHVKMPHINLPKIGGNKHGGCAYTGCNGREGWACSYKDLSKRECG